MTTQKSVGEGGEYQVHVLGQVVSPGIYQIGPSVRVADAISTAGGINQSGSVRHIQLREGQGKIRQIDLFKYTQNGDLGANPFVQENDVIFVPYLENTVRIEGPVRKTGVYELSNEKTVEDVIKLAGGYTVGVSEKGEVVIIRYEDEKRQLVKVANLSTELEKQPVQAGDVIVIPHIFTKNKKFDYNIAELPSDNIFYPSSKSTIFVVGSVSNGGAYPYNPNLSIQDYINMAGPNQLAKVSGARIMMSDGRINHSIKKYTLSPGDSIIVPEKKATVSNVLSWYSTLTSTLFSVIALRSLSQSF